MRPVRSTTKIRARAVRHRRHEQRLAEAGRDPAHAEGIAAGIGHGNAEAELVRRGAVAGGQLQQIDIVAVRIGRRLEIRRRDEGQRASRW